MRVECALNARCVLRCTTAHQTQRGIDCIERRRGEVAGASRALRQDCVECFTILAQVAKPGGDRGQGFDQQLAQCGLKRAEALPAMFGQHLRHAGPGQRGIDPDKVRRFGPTGEPRYL